MAPVPPFVIGKVPVTPGVIFAVPSKLALPVFAKFVLMVLAVCNLTAEVAAPPTLEEPA